MNVEHVSSSGPPGRPVVVVGVDGSAASVEAVRWAARQAKLIGAELHAVAAWQFPSTLSMGAPFIIQADDFERETRRLLDQALLAGLPGEPPVAVRRTVIEGPAGPVLVEQSVEAALLAVGAHGHNALAGLMLGSVSEYCARHAICPIVIVREPAAATV